MARRSRLFSPPMIEEGVWIARDDDDELLLVEVSEGWGSNQPQAVQMYCDAYGPTFGMRAARERFEFICILDMEAIVEEYEGRP